MTLLDDIMVFACAWFMTASWFNADRHFEQGDDRTGWILVAISALNGATILTILL